MNDLGGFGGCYRIAAHAETGMLITFARDSRAGRAAPEANFAPRARAAVAKDFILKAYFKTLKIV